MTMNNLEDNKSAVFAQKAATSPHDIIKLVGALVNFSIFEA